MNKTPIMSKATIRNAACAVVLEHGLVLALELKKGGQFNGENLVALLEVFGEQLLLLDMEHGRSAPLPTDDRRPALTDKQINDIVEKLDSGPSWDLRQFARIIERAIGPTLGVADTDLPVMAAQRLAEENEQLNQALDQMVPLLRADHEAIADAARYRWLRDVADRVDWSFDPVLFAKSGCVVRSTLTGCRLSGEQMDADIDAQNAQLNKETQG